MEPGRRNGSQKNQFAHAVTQETASGSPIQVIDNKEDHIILSFLVYPFDTPYDTKGRR